ncbi:hypothetical protein WS62_11945 [Burkholderia sp. ABCPW 14]|uniref:hypothetical protein n=1 Tax=Burkholderia sp. ABCPW 14 TaxID=1637860 RepID=UPI000770DB48|nr:hypothetical protein [Burkholderia sp. ABCPW 14]KVD70605.1 hypothetical protein WS62_11945 [Burkholderia sp. ABCPW 14]
MGEVEKNRVTASAPRGAIKMFFTGVFMTPFHITQVGNIASLLGIFLIAALRLVGIRAFDALRLRWRRKYPVKAL